MNAARFLTGSTRWILSYKQTKVNRQGEFQRILGLGCNTVGRSSFGVHPEKEIEMEAKGLHEIKEGKASILVNDENVFYNKAQVVNRDISIAVLKTFIKKRNEELKRNEKHMRHRAMKRLGSKANGNTTDDQKKTSTTSTTEREAPGKHTWTLHAR